jgi:tetratricopeptide (TPR) repeat protein
VRQSWFLKTAGSISERHKQVLLLSLCPGLRLLQWFALTVTFFFLILNKQNKSPKGSGAFLRGSEEIRHMNRVQKNDLSACEHAQAGKIDLDLKTREAKAYYSHGLLKEALGLYEHILSAGSEIKPDIQKSIEEKIVLIKKRIQEKEREDELLSPQDVSRIKEGWPGEENVNEILSSASAFKELGMFKEAIAEYNKLFAMDYPADKFISDIAQCLFAIHSPSRVIDQIEKIIEENHLQNHEKAKIKFRVGIEMEKKNHNDLALEFYNSVKDIDPEYTDIDTKINSLQAVRFFDSRYSYLLESKKVSAIQLQNALALSKKAKRSVELALMENFRIDKAEIGKSLSYFYKCPFKTFDPEMPIPHELLTRFKKAYLIQNSWVPLSWEMTGGVVEVLIDDPKDITKTDNISALIKAKKIDLSVGIKEDIVGLDAGYRV